MRRIFLVVLTFFLILGLTACSTKEEIKLDYIDMTPKEISDMPNYIEDYLEEARHGESYQGIITDNGLLLFASRGEMNTGGYDIKFGKAGVYQDKLYVEVYIEDPEKDSMVTQALTYPIALAQVSGDKLPKTIVFVSGNDYKKILKEVEVRDIPQPQENIGIIYFGTPDGYLRAETRAIEGQLSAEKGKVLIEEIIKGTTALDDTINVLPQGTKILNYNFDKVTGIATIDFSQHINAVHGSMGESLAVYAVVNTLTELPGIERVQFLVEGEKVEQIGGHIYMYDPLERELYLLEGNMLK